MYTKIVILLDRTGSMEPIRKDIIGGFNRFLAEQRRVIGTRITLIQFDSQDPHEIVYDTVPVSEAKELTEDTYIPRANTPLYDAIGRSILHTRYDGMYSSDLEKTFTKTIFVIITDGQENASREYDANRVREMIDQEKKNGWEFVFLSADLDSFAQARAIGIPPANTMAYDHNRDGTQSAFRSLSSNTVAYAAGDSVGMAWSDEDRQAQSSDRVRVK